MVMVGFHWEYVFLSKQKQALLHEDPAGSPIIPTSGDAIRKKMKKIFFYRAIKSSNIHLKYRTISMCPLKVTVSISMFRFITLRTLGVFTKRKSNVVDAVSYSVTEA